MSVLPNTKLHIPHDPGAPPHRPQDGGAESFCTSARTANTLSALAVCVDPHLGHFTFAALSDIDRAR